MEVVTYIVDAATLVNNINAIKQWVYDGSIRILIPLSVWGQIEEQYRISIAPKEPIKEHHSRKSWSKTPRKDHPLFDINPRIAWEFLSRARSDKGERGVIFQKEEEKFTQWEKSQEEVAKTESPPPPPTSFASAVLRKLDIQEAAESNGAKGPVKPKLVPRLGDSKTLWTYHKVPTISDSNIPENLRPVTSCLLWRVHEFQQNPVDLEDFALMSDNDSTRNFASSLNIKTKSSAELKQLVDTITKSADRRAVNGLLELDFPHGANGKIFERADVIAAKEAPANGHVAAPMQEKPRVNQNIGDLRETFESQKNVTHPREPLNHPQLFGPPSSPKLGLASHAHTEKPFAQAPIGTGRLRGSGELLPSANEREPSAQKASLLDSLMQGSSPDVPDETASIANGRPKSISPIGERKKVEEESDIDSDEEVIVFNPRARRASGRPKTPAGPSKSRPATSHGDTASNEGLKPPRSPIFSTLKPQSPVFTPGQAYVLTTSVAQEQHARPFPPPPLQPARSLHPQPPTKPAQGRGANSSPPAIASPGRSPQPRSATPRRPRADLQPQQQQQRHPSHDHMQHQSRMIIQRQREAIERSVHKTASKPPPRQVQMEPTVNPTVIDPDAFDRSYIVQPPVASPATPNGKPSTATRGARRRSPKGKESPKQPTVKPAEKPPATEADVDFVLKSGQPRGSMRGKGKLWIP